MTTNDWSDVPDFLTVAEAAGVMRIGRTSAYQLARHYLATGGKEGLPCVRNLSRGLRHERGYLL